MLSKPLTFSILTSRGTQVDIESTDPAESLDSMLRVAEALHRTIKLDDLQYDMVLRGTYVHNGRVERIVIVATGEGGASAADAMRAISWMNAVNE